jgi:hypothetical protein
MRIVSEEVPVHGCWRVQRLLVVHPVSVIQKSEATDPLFRIAALSQTGFDNNSAPGKRQVGSLERIGEAGLCLRGAQKGEPGASTPGSPTKSS